jgi:hypothetical protein
MLRQIERFADKALRARAAKEDEEEKQRRPHLCGM